MSFSATIADLPQKFSSLLILSFVYWTECCLILFLFALMVMFFLLLWRCWAFTIVPLLCPDRPNEVPYWIPFLGREPTFQVRQLVLTKLTIVLAGHTYAFLEDADGLLTYGREYFKNSNEPYALNVAGEKLYVLTSPQDMKAVRENNSTLSPYELTRDFIIALGLKPAVGKTICKNSMQGDKLNLMLRSGAMQKPFTQVVENFVLEKQNPILEQTSDSLHNAFIRHIEKSVRWNRLSAKYTKFTSVDEKEVSLISWCREVIVDAATRSYFDQALLQIEPNLTQIVFDFDNETCGSINKYPQKLGNLSSAAKEKGIRAFTAYLNLSKVQRAGEAQFVRDLEEEYRRLGLDEENLASLMMIVYWVINANTYKLTFWLLSNLVANPLLLSTVRTEIACAVPSSTSTLDITYLLQNCPILIASLNETLRLTSAPCTLHRILAPTTIGTKTLLPCSGSKVLTLHRQLHLCEEIFGPDVQNFHPSRFSQNPDLARSESFAGTSGMVVAEGAVLAFVALAVGRLGVEMAPLNSDLLARSETMAMEGEKKAVDMDLEKGCQTEERRQRFPRLDEKKGCLGIMGPLAGDDLILKLSRNVKGQ